MKKDNTDNKVEMNINQATEVVKIGEMFISSQQVDVKELLGLALGMLKDKNVINYLSSCESKKWGGRYLG